MLRNRRIQYYGFGAFARVSDEIKKSFTFHHQIQRFYCCKYCRDYGKRFCVIFEKRYQEHHYKQADNRHFSAYKQSLYKGHETVFTYAFAAHIDEIILVFQP